MKSVFDKYRKKERNKYIKKIAIGTMVNIGCGFCLFCIVMSILEKEFEFVEIFLILLIVLFLLVGIWMTVSSLICIINPNNGKLAKSIKSQANYDEEPLELIINEIENDMINNPHEFKDLLIGNEWVIGDEAIRITNISGVFPKITEIRGKTNITEYILYLVDKKNNLQANTMKNEDELYKAADIILSQASNAVTGKMEDLL